MKKDSLFFKVITQLDIIIACVAILILIVATFFGVPMRYVVGRPLVWLEEVQSACLVWIVFSSAGAAFRTGSHVAIEMIVDRFPKNVQKIWQIVMVAVVSVVIGYLFIQSLGFIKMFLNSGRSTAMLTIPYSTIYLICPISFLLQIGSFIYSTIRDWNKIGVEQKMEVSD